MFEHHTPEIREASRARGRISQQRQTILMGASGPVWLCLALLICLTQVRAWDASIGYFTADEFQSLFGPDGCIEGVIVSMPTAPTIMPAAGNVVQNNAKNNAHMLMANEGDNNGNAGQRPLQNNLTAPTVINNGNNISNVANTKEKTPMCLVNELARFNKIQHQYRLTNEQGPAHKKRFTVTLKLGDEEYSAEGPSIKKAQHSAAADALTQTQYKHPPPKTTKNVRLGKSTYNDGNITPTVELNALAMKRGEPAIYTFMEHNTTNQPQHQQPNLYMAPQHNYTGYRGMYNQRYYNKGPNVAGFQPPLFMVSLRVGSREFYGEGPSAQGARHDAASKAVHQLKQLPLPDDAQCQNNDSGNDTIETDVSSELKSPISLVHEIALKRNLNVTFEVTSEKGPPHMRTFTTRCIVGETITTGEGNGKKISKKRAAEKMLDELKLLPPCSPSNMATSTRLNKRKQNPGKKKSRNLIKVYHQETKSDEYNEDINPISRLIQIQQAKKEREPVYTLIEERGVPRRREFVMEVSIGDHSSTGSGSNKKLAKRAAAEALLQLLGYARASPQPNKPTLKAHETPLAHDDKNRKVTFQEDAEKTADLSAPGPGGSGGRQLVPGLLLMTTENSHTHLKSSGNSQSNAGLNLLTTAAIAKELLNGGNSPTAEALQKNSKPLHTSSQAVRPKDQLMYLSDLLGFQVQFSDFPKGNHSEFLSLVSLSTDPPQVCHGAGTTTDTSHDQAALKALKALSEMGLDTIAPAKKDSSGGIHAKANVSLQK